MLHNTPSHLSTIQEVLVKMSDSKIDFHATGSRFFGRTHPKSDWDFIAEHTIEAEEFLRQLGFLENKEVTDYLDPMTTKVLTKYFCVHEDDYFDRHMHSEDCLKIDVQLAHDLPTKLKVRDILKEHFPNQGVPGDKSERSKIWTMVYSLVKTS